MAKPENADPVEKARAALAALTPKAPGEGTVFGQVEALYGELIAARRDKHYTDAELVDMLAANGISITLGTFQQYMRRIAKSQGERPAKAPVKAAERKVNANANAHANPSVAPSPKPSEVAAKGKANGGERKPQLGHKLGDEDV